MTVIAEAALAMKTTTVSIEIFLNALDASSRYTKVLDQDQLRPT